MLISLSNRFPYLNDKILKINKYTLAHPKVIPEFMLDYVNTMILKSNLCEIEPMPELDKVYKDIRFNNKLIIPKRINDRVEKLILKTYLELNEKYHRNILIEHLHDLNAIWEYLPKYLQDGLAEEFEDAMSMLPDDLLEFNLELNDLRVALNPFVISNELDKLISMKK